ncbi:chemotaxis protein CheA [Nocardioides sp. BP30]|uniref:chemotaxis protein CheA n=1 Tax=Nocardioides sp. BP30 TaxID=3036374 RepID=UPI002468B18C|nr:chemotaxis protein CheA [Nocardioides sp. BP30]WGL51894.1 chemotaxis protein CheA [Nocardioides sp. BP30]
MDDDAEIIAEFLVESHENLDQLDRDLVELEQHPGSRELLSSIFRTIHTIKGTSGFLAFGRLERLTHVGETLLSKLRDGEYAMNDAIAEALLRMVDTVRALLDGIERVGNDKDPAVDVVPVQEAIELLLANGGQQSAPAEPVEAEEPAAVAEETAEATETVEAEETVEAASSAVEPVAVEPVAVEPVADEPVAVEPVAPPAPVVEPQPVAEQTEQPVAEPGEPWDGTERRSVADSSVRVDVELLDNLVQLVGELVLTRNQILQRTESQDDPELIRASQRLDLVASELQESVMKTRMQPIGQVWSKMPRIVRDLARQLGREVELSMDGHDTEMDRSVLEAVKDPLTHMVRNSMDHGIERPEERVAAGKSRAGKLTLRAFHESGQVVVEIADDGKGIDPDRIAAVALDRGVVSREQLARMDTKEIVNLIFRPGFSTAETITNVSGRGVGMDVVRSNIERIGGSVDLTSEVGKGSTFRIRIPLTLAIIPALIVGEGTERYAIPQANLVELVRIEGEDLDRQVEDLAGSPVLRLRGRLLPLVNLAEALGDTIEQRDHLTVVVVQADDVRFGLCVNEVHDTQEIVVKPIGRQLKGLAMYAGATIMGDGRVALILDVPGMAQEQGVGAVEQELLATRAAAVDEEERTALLVLEVADGRRAALPLAAVARLEEFPRDRVERTGGNEVVQYRDGLLPLVRLAPAIGLMDTSDRTEQVSVVVHELADRSVGIVIDRVLDVVETAVVLSEVGRRYGVTGSAVVQEHVTDLVDLEAVVARTGVSA